MARPLRIEYEGAVYHVTSRGNERKLIFKEASDRSLFLDILYQANKEIWGHIPYFYMPDVFDRLKTVH